jgi:hypothetical protein
VDLAVIATPAPGVPEVVEAWVDLAGWQPLDAQPA